MSRLKEVLTEELLLELKRRNYVPPFPERYKKYALRTIDDMIEQRVLDYRLDSTNPRDDPFLKPIYALRDWIETGKEMHLRRLLLWTQAESDIEIEDTKD